MCPSPVDSNLKRCPRASEILPLVYRMMFVGAIFLLFSPGLNSEAYSATYFLSPSGSDGNAGTASAAPWKTFSFAIPWLQPADTLILKNGTYNRLNSGYPDIDCSRNAKNGTSQKPITVKAENERQALIDGDGLGSQVAMENCAYWVIAGLYVKNMDNIADTGNNSNVKVLNSNHITLRRLVVTFNNRYKNTHLITLTNTHDSLVEESELYNFHRHGILNGSGGGVPANRNTYRRLYANSRGHADIPLNEGGFGSIDKNKGDSSLSIYPGVDNIIENVISEKQSKLVEINATATTTGNKVLGSISIGESIS